ncbi:PREDICTED: transducin beta-like protein 3 [Priapulus caudatus]|uniref:Transducin beta-like protein 3 n=1 Tax=Priapulus caudatus TaxID=37621 RepID=A0ABM1EJJ6_PRICU|nr:PREDICTED: transducin beta-like protein 3 [Priapulus caudatus]
MAAPMLKANFAVQTKYEAFYKGGNVQLSHDGLHLFCCCGNQVKILDVQTGKVEKTVGQDGEDDITSFVVSPDDEYLVIATKNLLLKQWDWKEEKCIRTWKAIHTAPILTMSFDSTSTLLATGSSDSTIKVWDIVRQYCTHNLKGSQGVISAVCFHPDISRLQVISSSLDCKVRVWSLETGTCDSELEGHFSVPTGFDFSQDGNTLLSCGRDKVVILWNLKTSKMLKTVPVYETLEGVVLLRENTPFPALNIPVGGTDDLHFLTAGERGVLRVWNSKTSKCVYSSVKDEALESSADDGGEIVAHSIVHLSYHSTLAAVLVVKFDHTVLLHGIDDLAEQKQFVGFNDEILDIKLMGAGESHIAVATNSPNIKVFELATFCCQVLKGHSDIVLALDVSNDGSMLASSSKDNTLRLWEMNSNSHIVSCVAFGAGHTHAINGIALGRCRSNILVSVSDDQTFKIWTLPSDLSAVVRKLHVQCTEKAHDKEINAVSVSPNDRLLATGSHDKTAKIWSTDDGKLLGVCRGHKRGIWCVQFSPVDQVIATGSGDGTVKIWALNNFTCVKTFEGHDASVLKVTFISKGMQLLTGGSDGLLKLWTIKLSECIRTFDEHEAKLWALTIAKDEACIVTGAADSNIIMWKDVTETEVEEARAKQEAVLLQEQRLSNLVHNKKYLKAIGLAITLEMPFKVLTIMKEILNGQSGIDDLAKTVTKLRMDQIGKENVFYPHLGNVLKEHLSLTYANLSLHTERHLQRMNRLVQQATFVDYTWQCMRTITSAIEPAVTDAARQQGLVFNKQLAPTENGNDDGDMAVAPSNVRLKASQQPDSTTGNAKRKVKRKRSQVENKDQPKSVAVKADSGSGGATNVRPVGDHEAMDDADAPNSLISGGQVTNKALKKREHASEAQRPRIKSKKTRLRGKNTQVVAQTTKAKHEVLNTRTAKKSAKVAQG